MGLKSYPKAYFELMLVGFILVLGMNLPSAFLPIFARQLDPVGVLVGLVLSSWFISRLFTELPFGIWADRFGKCRLLIGGLAISAVGAFVCSTANVVYTLILGWGLWGLGTGLFFMCSSAIIFDLFKPSIKGQALGTFQALEFLGGFIGAPIGAFMVGIIDYKGPFLVASVLMVFTFLLAYLSKELRQTDEKNTKQSPKLYIREVLPSQKNWGLTTVYINSFSRMLVWTGVTNTFFPLYVNLELGISVELIGLIVSIRTMGLIIATAASSFLSDKFGKRPMIVTGIILEAASFYAYTLGTSFELLMLIGLVEGLGRGIVLTLIMVLLSDIVSPRFRGGALGMYRTFMDLGGFVGPIFFMVMYGAFGSYYTFILALIVNIVNVALTLTAKTP